MREFDEIYAEYFSKVYGYVLCLCRSPDTAEEITQEAFFKALKSIGSFRGECSIGTWLCGIAKNTYTDCLKKQKRQAEFPEEESVDTGLSPEASYEEKETVRSIHRILHGLPEPYKEVFWLRTYGELPFSQIGELFGKTESWARVTYHRARLKIKEELS